MHIYIIFFLLNYPFFKIQPGNLIAILDVTLNMRSTMAGGHRLHRAEK